jgi:HK97 family phage prohead protease
MTELLVEQGGELRFRASELVGVDFPERTIDLIVMPYEQAAVVSYGGRAVTETIERGAFDGIERRASRVHVNRDHQVQRLVGRAVAFYPSRQEGLVAKVRIARTQLGDETLQLAEEGDLDASAGFRPMGRDGESWESSTRVKIRKAWLAHIALTPEPAYAGAKVLAVRDSLEPAAAATPNLDYWRQLVREEMYSRVDV